MQLVLEATEFRTKLADRVTLTVQGHALPVRSGRSHGQVAGAPGFRVSAASRVRAEAGCLWTLRSRWRYPLPSGRFSAAGRGR
jgi:hypothetical protein